MAGYVLALALGGLILGVLAAAVSPDAFEGSFATMVVVSIALAVGAGLAVAELVGNRTMTTLGIALLAAAMLVIVAAQTSSDPGAGDDSPWGR